MAGIILSADIGTSSLKAAFIDFDGRLLAFGRVVYPKSRQVNGLPPLACTRDTNGNTAAGTKGVSASAWERAFAEALESLHTLAPDSEIDGICLSGNGPTLVPVTCEGEALPPLYWYDGRTAFPPAKPITDTGNDAPSFFLPHAAWLKKNAPEEYKKTSFFVSSHEWLASRLGAETLTVLPQAAYEPYYWNDEQCRLFGLDREKFPPFVKMGNIMGKVSAKAASNLGLSSGNYLKSGIPIIAGGPDFITALIGTAALKPGDVCDRAGSSEGINVCVSDPVKKGGFAEAAGSKDTGTLGDIDIRVLPHAKEGFWNVGAVISSSGKLFEWYRIATGQEDRNYEDHLAELIPAPEDTEVFRDIIVPKNFWAAQFRNSFHQDSVALGRGVLCAMGFAVRSAVEILEARGFSVREMRVSGGQARNLCWNQLKADITGISLIIPEIPDGELAGNAVLSAAALDHVSGPAETNFERTAARMIRIREVYRPGPEAVSFWEERYRIHSRR